MAQNKTNTLLSSPRDKSKRPKLVMDLIRRLYREKPLGAIGGIIIILFLLTGIFADFLAPYDMNAMHEGSFLKPPSALHLLGTDNLGRDELSRIIFGARISMIVGLCGTSIATVFGTVIGVTSGFYGGKFDIMIQRFVDAIMCFPWLFIVLSIMAILGPGPTQVILVLGFIYGIRDSRIVRSAVIRIKEDLYVHAAQAIGSSDLKTITRHILPNISAPIIIIFTIGMGNMILSEATLSFLGMGIPPPQPSWGGMLTIGGRQYMLFAPWLVLWPGLALAIVVFGINMLGDAARDILDPRLRGGIGRYGTVKNKKTVRREMS